MMGMTDYGANVIAEAFVGISTTPNLYLALTAFEPEESDTADDLVEPSDAAYARQAVLMGGLYWAIPYSGVSTYAEEIAFPTATEDWEGMYYWALCTDLTSGQIILWGNFDAGYQVTTGNQAIIPPNAFGVAVSSESNVTMA
jgi:hypothetical protein